MVERLDDLRQSLIAKLDAMDGDPDLEPYLSTLGWGEPPEADECEPDTDLGPSLSAGALIDQRRWITGGDTTSKRNTTDANQRITHDDGHAAESAREGR